MLDDNFSPTHELFPRQLSENAVEARGNPLRSKQATASASFEREDDLDGYLDTPLFADCNDRRFAKAIVKRVKEAESHGRKQKMQKEEEGQLPNSKKRKVEMLVLD